MGLAGMTASVGQKTLCSKSPNADQGANRSRKLALAPDTALRYAIPSMPSNNLTYRNLFRAIVTDLHFWIPLTVLIGGLFLLDKLR